ncbi:MAG TPA: 3-deoxy-D-manno-octulosonic acid transferase [Burkholderiaceae bacterium]|nr:3-deoxy-D-manno-octulosonic acid transferase [Burkholderiaceae bacterium]
MARAAWSWLLRLLLPLIFMRLWWRGRREPGYRLAWRERLGFGAASEPGAVWVHAVSLGETRAASALIDALRARVPGVRILLTHGTATGREAGGALLRAGDHQCWLPYDTPGATRRFLRRHRPAVGVLMETEVWPNLLLQAHGAGVPMVLANARLSERSARKGQRLSALIAPAARAIDLVLAQTRGDAARLSAAGARAVEVSGNLKFDMAPDATLVARGRQWRAALQRPVVMMASSREGEEPPLLQAWSTQPAPRPLLLLVPRHPQRFDTVAQIVRDAQLSLKRRSEWTETPPSDAEAADVWLGDSLGEMPLYYAASDVALLGGSFAPLGGQNLIEAAACACPVVMGPHTFNFEQAADNAVAERAALRVAHIDEGVVRAIELTRDALHAQWAERAAAFAQMHKGAAQRMADRIVQLAEARIGARAAGDARVGLAG